MLQVVSDWYKNPHHQYLVILSIKLYFTESLLLAFFIKLSIIQVQQKPLKFTFYLNLSQIIKDQNQCHPSSLNSSIFSRHHNTLIFQNYLNMEILIISNPQAPYPQLKSLSSELVKTYPSCHLRQIPSQTNIEVYRKMDQSISRIAIVLTKSIFPQQYRQIRECLHFVNCQVILYPEKVNGSESNNDSVVGSKAELLKKIKSLQHDWDKNNNPKSIRMIAIKQTAGQYTERQNWNTLGFNVFRTKDIQFNKQMNMIFYKYKNNPNVKFNQIREIQNIPQILGQKQILIVSHADANLVIPKFQILHERSNKVFKILFNTSPKMLKSYPQFDVNANKISIIQSEVDTYLSKLSSETNSEKYKQPKSKTNLNIQSSFNNTPQNQKIPSSLKTQDLWRLYILDNNNPEFKQMFQNLQIEATIIQNLHQLDPKNSKIYLLAPYETKDILITKLDSRGGIKVVLYCGLSNQQITQNNISPMVCFIGKSSQQIKGFFKNKIKFNQPKSGLGRTVKFIEDAPGTVSGTSIDRSLFLNKQVAPTNYEWTVRKKPNNNKFIVFPSGQQEQYFNVDSFVSVRSMRKMTSKKKTMIELIERQPSIQIIESSHNIESNHKSNGNQKIQAENHTQMNKYLNQNIGKVVIQDINNKISFNNHDNQFRTQMTSKDKIQNFDNTFETPKLPGSSRLIQEETNQTVICVKNLKKNPNFSKNLSTLGSTNQNLINIHPGQSVSTPKQSSLQQNITLNLASSITRSPSFMSKNKPEMQFSRNLQIQIKPEARNRIKQQKQVIQIMTSRSAEPQSLLNRNEGQFKQQVSQQPTYSHNTSSIDPSFVDQKYQRVIENDRVKYVLKQKYKDQLIKKILHQRNGFSHSPSQGYKRTYSTKKQFSQPSHYQYFSGGSLFSPRVTSQQMPANYVNSMNFYQTSSFKENAFPSKNQQTFYEFAKASKKILYIVPKSRQTILNKIMALAKDNEVVHPYRNQTQLNSIDFSQYKLVLFFPKDQNKKSLLDYIPNFYTIKLSGKSQIFSDKEVLIRDLRQIPQIVDRLMNKLMKNGYKIQSSMKSLLNVSYSVVVPRQMELDISNELRCRFYGYSNLQDLYELLQRLKNQYLVVVIHPETAQFIEDFQMPLSTKYIIYRRESMNMRALVQKIKQSA